MSCTGCSNHTSASNASDAAFGRFWPVDLPGPRLLPWLGVASRDEARAGALAIGADRDPGVLAGDEPAMPHLIGRTMGGGGVYAQERKGREKEPRVPTRCQICWEEAEADCRTKGGVYRVDSPNGDGFCRWLCVSDVRSGGGGEPGLPDETRLEV